MRTGQCHVQRYMKPLLEKIQDGSIDPSFVITHTLDRPLPGGGKGPETRRRDSAPARTQKPSAVGAAPPPLLQVLSGGGEQHGGVEPVGGMYAHAPPGIGQRAAQQRTDARVERLRDAFGQAVRLRNNSNGRDQDSVTRLVDASTCDRPRGAAMPCPQHLGNRLRGAAQVVCIDLQQNEGSAAAAASKRLQLPLHTLLERAPGREKLRAAGLCGRVE
jgi:hypothetical protein